MKNNFAADTMAIILRLEKRRLSSVVKSLFKKAEDGEISLWIPAMALAELAYLSEKKKIHLVLTLCVGMQTGRFTSLLCCSPVTGRKASGRHSHAKPQCH